MLDLIIIYVAHLECVQHFSKTRQNPYLFFSCYHSNNTPGRTAGSYAVLQIPLLIFTIENANTIRTSEILALKKHWTMFGVDVVPIMCWLSNLTNKQQKTIKAFRQLLSSFFTPNIFIVCTENYQLWTGGLFSLFLLSACLFICLVVFIFQKMAKCYKWIFKKQKTTKKRSH